MFRKRTPFAKQQHNQPQWYIQQIIGHHINQYRLKFHHYRFLIVILIIYREIDMSIGVSICNILTYSAMMFSRCKDDLLWRVKLKMSVNKRIRDARVALGLSQAKFAERIAMSASYVANIEIDKRQASERIVMLIAAEYNVNEHWLLTGEGSMFDEETDAHLAKLVSSFKMLNPQFQECALHQIDELVSLQGLILKS